MAPPFCWELEDTKRNKVFVLFFSHPDFWFSYQVPPHSDALGSQVRKGDPELGLFKWVQAPANGVVGLGALRRGQTSNCPIWVSERVCEGWPSFW